MSVIYLIRHGQASFGQENYDQLSEIGHRQAGILGESLANRVGEFDHIVMGGMFRHKQTANNCLAGMKKQLNSKNHTVDSGWDEYDHQDILAQLGDDFKTPQSIENYVRRQSDPKTAFETVFNGAMDRWMSGEHDADYVESWQYYQRRIKTALLATTELAKTADKVAVFSSGGPISVVSQHLLGVEPNKVMHINWTIVNCSVTKLVSTPSRLFLSSLNEHSHFEGQYKKLITYK